MKSRQQSEDSFGVGRMALAQRTGIQRPDTGLSWGLLESSVCYSGEKTTRAEGGPRTSSTRNQGAHGLGLLNNSNGNKQTVMKIFWILIF